MESENPAEPTAEVAATPSPSTESNPSTESSASPEPGANSPSVGDTLGLVSDVPLRVTVEVGSTQMLVREVLKFTKGSVIDLDRASGEPADVLVNGRLLAKGEVTVEDDRLAVRIVEMLIDPPSS